MRYLMPPDLLVSTWSTWTSGRGRCRLRERSGNAKHIHWSNWRRDEQASQQSPEEQFDSVHNPPFYRYCGAIEDDMTKEETIDLLNELIHVCKDGEHGYRTAAEDVRNSQLQSVFSEYAKQRGSCARQLQAEVERLGGVGADSGTFTAAVHRGWIDLKAALSGGDGGAIIAACETGEDYTLAAFERVVNAGITGESLSIVEKQCGKIKEAHTRLVRLKDEIARGAEFQQNE